MMHTAFRAMFAGAFALAGASQASALTVTYNLDAVADDGISTVYGHFTVDSTLQQVTQFHFRTTLHDNNTGIDTSFVFNSDAIRYANPQEAGDINSRRGTEFNPAEPYAWWITGFEGDFVQPIFWGEPVLGGGPETRHGFTISGGMLMSGHSTIPIMLSAETEVIQGMYSPYGPPHGYGYNNLNFEY